MLALMAALLTACNRGSTDQTAYMKNATVSTPAAMPAQAWPSFAARDYRSFHKQTLTAGEVSSIRKTLSAVKPCQRRFLRFAFASNAGFVLFFDLSNTIWPRVLWTDNTYYKKIEGTVFQLSGPRSARNSGIEWAVRTTGCDGRLIT
jgi:hypothetical protein